MAGLRGMICMMIELLNISCNNIIVSKHELVNNKHLF